MSNNQQAVTNYQSKDQASNLQQSAQNKAISGLASNPLNGGSHLTGISLAAGTNVIPHKLGKKLSGCIPVSPDAAVTIHQTASDDKTVTLTASGAVNCSLFVF